MTAGYLVSLLHRCTSALGKERHQSYSSARRQSGIISGKVFTASVKNKKWKACQEKNWMLGKEQQSLSVKKFLFQDYWWGLLGRALQEVGSRGHSSPQTKWTSPSATAGDQWCTVISLSFFSCSVNKVYSIFSAIQKERWNSSRKLGRAKGFLES